MRTTRRCVVSFLALALCGCASVHVYKATESGSLPDGTRDDGVPFYLPRPYVQVYEPFVIASDAFLATGRISPDGQYLVLENLPQQLQGIAVSSKAEVGAVAIPLANIGAPGSTIKGGFQAGPAPVAPTADAAASAAASTASAANAASVPVTASSAASAPAATASASSTGQANLSVAQAATPFTPTLGRRFFDVVWMPDFDEKYIVQGKPGLGNSTIGITMTQGWGLYGLDAKIDNRAILQPLLDFYSSSLSALSKLAQSKIFPTGSLQAGTAPPQPGKQQPQLPPGTQVSVKVTKVSVVAPGLYPILKPKEAEHAEVTRTGSINGKVLVPMRPYTNIAFNIYDVLVVEAAKPTGDSPMNLQKYFDASATPSPVGTAADRRNTMAAFDTDKFKSTVNALLKSHTGKDGAYWQVADVVATATQLQVTVSLSGGSQAPSDYPTAAQLKQVLLDSAKPHYNNVNSIVVTPAK